MRRSKASQRSYTDLVLVEFRNETKCDAVRFEFIVNCLDLDKMSKAQLKGLEMILDHALTCLCEAEKAERWDK